MITPTFAVKGMYCSSCGILMDETLEELPGVASVSTDVRSETSKVEFDPARIGVDDITAEIAKLGYRAQPA